MIALWLLGCSCSGEAPPVARERAPAPASTGETGGVDSAAPTGDTAPVDLRIDRSIDEAFATFQSTGGYEDRGLGYRSALLDFDLDGRVDVAVSGLFHTWVWSVPPEGGAFTTDDAAWFLEYEGIQGLHVADFNGDGHDDLLTDSGYGQIRMHFAPYPAGGSIALEVDEVHAAFAEQLGVDDYDNDGHLDVLFEESNRLKFFYGPFAPGATAHFGSTVLRDDPTGLIDLGYFSNVGDINGDGSTDVMTKDGIPVGIMAGPFPAGLVDEPKKMVKLNPYGPTFSLPVRVDGMTTAGESGIVLQQEDSCLSGIAMIKLPLPYDGTVDGCLEGESNDAIQAAHDFDGDGHDDLVLHVYDVPDRSLVLIMGPLDRPELVRVSEDWSFRIREGAVSIPHVYPGGIRDVNGDGVPDLLLSNVQSAGAYLHLVELPPKEAR